MSGCGVSSREERQNQLSENKPEDKPVTTDPYAALRPIWEAPLTEAQESDYDALIGRVAVLNERRETIKRERPLKEELLRDQSIYINGILSPPLSEIGSGGCKSALDLSNGRVLLLPRSLDLPVWLRIVHEEIAFSCFLLSDFH